MKIQKQIDKYTVQTLGGNCPPREDNDSYVPNTAQAPYKTATNTNNLLYRLLFIVQPGVFTHDCSVLLTAPPPPPANIYTEVVLGRGKEEEEFTTLDTRYSTFVTFVYTHTSSVHHCIPYIFKHYCIVLEQYTFLGNSTHYTYFTCSLTPLAAALFHSTV